MGPARDGRRPRPDAGVPDPPGGWDAALRMDGPADLTVFLAHVAAAYPVLGRPRPCGGSLARPSRMPRRTAATTSRSASGHPPIDGPGSIARRHRRHVRGLDDGRQATGLPGGLVVCLLRHDEDETNLAVARAAAAAAGPGVVGLDVAGDELRFPSNAPYRAPFAIAAAAGLGLTAHAAEAGPASAAREAASARRPRGSVTARPWRDDPAVARLGSRTWSRPSRSARRRTC